jgi:short-subunit dehydrogenase
VILLRCESGDPKEIIEQQQAGEDQSRVSLLHLAHTGGAPRIATISRRASYNNGNRSIFQESIMQSAPVILITGASSGIGAATARQFARQGYRVVLAARRFDRLEALAEEICQAGGQALPVQADLARLEDIQALAQAALAAYGQIDVLFNNAGFGRLGWLEGLDAQEDIQAVLQVNLVGLVQMTQAVLPHMIARRSGHIINMASVAAYIATPTYSVYAASKFGVRGFSEALRREVGVYGIRVSLISPGGTETEFAGKAGIRRKTGIRTPPFLRLEADDVAQAVLKLATHPRRNLLQPWPMQLAVWANMLIPGLLDWVIRKRFVGPERFG